MNLIHFPCVNQIHKTQPGGDPNIWVTSKQSANKWLNTSLGQLPQKPTHKKKPASNQWNCKLRKSNTWPPDTLEINDGLEEYIFFFFFWQGSEARHQHQHRYHTPFPSRRSFHRAVRRLDWEWLKGLASQSQERCGNKTTRQHIWSICTDIGVGMQRGAEET